MALILFMILLLLPIFLSEEVCNTQDPILVNCDFSSNYTIPSPFKANLDVLLSNLPDSAASSNNLFFNYSVGTASDVVYGLAQCRPDMSAYDCAICLYRAAFSSSSECLLSRSATIRFDKCILRFSDRPFFSQVSYDMDCILINVKNVSNPTVFSKPLRKLMNEVSSKAPMNDTKFALASFNDSTIGDIYGMAECTRDLTDAGCSACLNQILPVLLDDFYYTQGCRVFSMSCLVRFEINPILAQPLPPPPPLPR